jgi:TRAP transporter TAXI family solute receptor
MHRERPSGSGVMSAGCLSIVLLIAACAAPPPPAPRQTLKVLVYQQVNDGVPETLAQAFGASLSNADVEVRRGGSSSDSVEALQRGEADVAIAGADSVYLSSVGQPDGQSAPLDYPRAIAVLQPRLIQLVVGKTTGIESVKGLRGHRVAYSGSTSSISSLVLEAFGLRNGDVELVPLEIGDKLAQLMDGRLEAALFYGTYPVDEVNAAIRAGSRMLALAGPDIDRLREQYPFLRPIEIPDIVYHDRTVKTIGLNLVLICRSDLDESTVHAITKALFDALPALSTSDASFRYVDLEQASATPVALHAGAARFYRERELAR